MVLQTIVFNIYWRDNNILHPSALRDEQRTSVFQ